MLVSKLLRSFKLGEESSLRNAFLCDEMCDVGRVLSTVQTIFMPELNTT